MSFSQRFSTIINNDKIIFGFCALVISCYCLPFTILGENASIFIPDNLDSNFVWYKVILDQGMVFSPNNMPVESFMNGAPRSSFPSELNFNFLWFWLFDPIGGYIFERWLFVLIAFWGMFLLLCKFIIPGKEFLFIQAGVALTFSLIPLWPFGALSIYGLPFILYAFLNLRSGNSHYANWLIIIIFPFYSSLIYTGCFFLGLILLLIIFDLVQKKKINRKYIYAFLLINLLYVFANYRLFDVFFINENFVSHRADFAFPKQELFDSLREFSFLIYTGNHFILFSIVLAGILMWNYDQFSAKFKFTFLFVFISAFFVSFSYSKYFVNIYSFLFSIIPINLQRVSLLYPLLFFILFSISLVYIHQKLVIGKYLIIILLMGQLAYDFRHHEIIVSTLGFKNNEKGGALIMKVDPSIKGFFAEKQFAEISKYIGLDKSKFRVLSLGMHPSVSQYNGFYTLDGYLANYDKRYKLKFREIIKDEIKKNQVLREYYDYWGSRAYLFTAADIGYVNVSGNSIVLKNLDFNTQAMKDLGGKYIISAVKIDTKTDPEYKFLKKFQNKESAWDIYLYEIL